MLVANITTMFLSQIAIIASFVWVLTEAIEVEISTGRVRGVTGKAHDGTPVSIFRGIPYAEPPVGQLRWKLPQPIEPWQNVLDASEYGPGCIQRDGKLQTYTGLTEMSEDCLTLNVYAPDLNAGGQEKLAVMIWIHGGGYNMDWSGNPMYHGEELVRKNVIVVSGNYRLGIMGYMSTESDLVPGNFGMHDQIEIMKWVQKNIHVFNGDKDRVTIFGESAGASSVSLHMLSPLSEGLFHNVIAQSGSSMCIWSVEPEPLKFTKRLAELVDCPTDTNTPEEEEAMVECLREIDGVTLMEQQIPKYDSAVPFAPVVDGKFLTDMPDFLLSAGLYNKDVKLITGATKDEGFSLLSVYADVPALDVTYDIFANYITPILLEKGHFYDPVYALRDAIIFEYTNWDDPIGMRTAEDRPILNLVVGERPWNAIISATEMLGDGGIKAPMDQESLYHSWNEGSVWVYALDFISENSPFKPMVIHGTDIFYVFGMAWSNATICFNELICIQPGNWILQERDEIFSDYMMDLWTNFAKHGDPTPEKTKEDAVIWQKYENNTRYFLRLDENSTLEQHYAARANQYWNNYIYELENTTSIFDVSNDTTTITPPTTGPSSTRPPFTLPTTATDESTTTRSTTTWSTTTWRPTFSFTFTRPTTTKTTEMPTEEPEDETDTVLIIVWVLLAICCLLLILVTVEIIAIIKLSKTSKTEQNTISSVEENKEVCVTKEKVPPVFANSTYMSDGDIPEKF